MAGGIKFSEGAVDVEPAMPQDGNSGPAGRDVGVTLRYLVDRFGPASGKALFERMDGNFRQGDRVYGTPIRTARETFGAARKSGHARLVVRGRPGGAEASRQELDEGMLMIGLDDFEAIVKASRVEFDWRAEFTPRADLQTATMPLVVRSGAPGRRMLKP